MQSQWPTTDELLRLAKENPDALEALRQREIEKLINSAPEKMQRRLRGLQFQIDAKRQISKNPMASCIEISRMMFDAVHDLNRCLNGQFQEPTPAKRKETGAVIAFPVAAMI
ncbi:MAG: DUF3135 domain-containing protein [Marinagarivorans sp.]|nr:DUF3135 domain-containing protein [Marinagarivorans sp.]